MKKILLSSATVALLVFSGCADKEPVVEEEMKQETRVVKKKAAEKVEKVETETVLDSQAMVDEVSNNVALSAPEPEEVVRVESDYKELTMEELERSLTSVYFDYDKFGVRSDMTKKVEDSAFIANGGARSYMVKLEGNCDEWGSDEYNFALGLKRASTVKKALIAEGVSEGRITMVSYGESNPSCNDKTQDCWAENRRVDFKLLP